MATKRVFNPTDRPVVIDSEGHVLGGGEWGDVDDKSDVVPGLLEQELLLPVDSTPKSPSSAKSKE